jgi:hypothetical protein
VGNLPTMTTVQFADHASHTLAEAVIPGFSADHRAELATDVRGLREKIAPLPLTRIKPPILFTHNEELYASMGRVEHDRFSAAYMEAAASIIHYADNPFIVPPGERNVSVVEGDTVHYTLEPHAFYSMATYVIYCYALGAIDEPSLGLPYEIKDAVARIETAL